MPPEPPFTRRAALALLASAVAVVQSGCSNLPGFAEPPALFTLTPKSTFPAGLQAVNWQLLVESPIAAAALDTVRISVRRTPLRIEYFAAVAWTERAPRMVQTLLVESFENTGAITAVGRETFGLRADYVLKTELREFQIEDAGSGARPLARVRLVAKLVRMPRRLIVASRPFEALETAASRRFGDLVLALDAAAGDVMKDLVVWVLSEGQTDWRQEGEGRRRP